MSELTTIKNDTKITPILIGPQTDCNRATLKYAKLLLTLEPILVLGVHLLNKISLKTSNLSYFPNELLLKYSKKRHSHRFSVFGTQNQEAQEHLLLMMMAGHVHKLRLSREKHLKAALEITESGTTS